MKRLITLLTAIVFTTNLLAQSPQKMSYQAVVRDNNSALITSAPIGMRISIIQGSASGTSVYSETHTANTNANGLVSLEIGTGTSSDNFTSINWANGPYFIKTETDPTGGVNYTIIGTSELLSVPYALHAKTAESITGGVTETDPVFVASPANGISSADISNWNNKLSSEVDGSVTNELQTLSISNDTVYLSNGGFAKLPAGFNGDYNSLINKPTAVSSFSNDAGYLTSFTEVDGSVTNELQTLSISNDTVYLSNGGFAKLPAGFNGDYNSLTNKPTAVSSFSNDAGYLTSFTEVDGSVTNELQALSISNDTIYLSNGGFAKLPANNAWSLNGNSGTNVTSNFIGTIDDKPLKFRINNVKSGKIVRQTNDIFFGYNSGNDTNTGHENSAIGTNTMKSLTSGWGNSALGFDVLTNATTGLFNTGMGYIALNLITSGRYNTGVGSWALQSNTTGESNAAFGMFSIPFNQTGNYNTSIGAYSGYNATGSGNVFLGYQAGYNELGSNKLIIANSNTTTPLIYGDFTSGNIGIGTTSPTEKIVVAGNAKFGATGQINIWEWDNIEKIGIDYNTVNGDFNMRNPIAGKRLLGTISNTGSWGIENTTGTELVRVTGAGNMGIGTTSPTAKLQVENYGFASKSIWSINSMLIQNQTPGARTLFALAPNGAQNADLLIFHNSDYTTNFECLSFGYENTANYFNIATNKGGTATQRGLILDATSVASNLRKQLVLNPNGYVGIGTLNPGTALEVNGAIKVTGGTSSQFLKADGSVDSNTYLTAIYEAADEFTATASQTSFTLTQTPSANSKVKMYINGVRISNTAYSVSGTTLTYVPANNGSYSLSVGDRVQFDYSY